MLLKDILCFLVLIKFYWIIYNLIPEVKPEKREFPNNNSHRLLLSIVVFRLESSLPLYPERKRDPIHQMPLLRSNSTWHPGLFHMTPWLNICTNGICRRWCESKIFFYKICTWPSVISANQVFHFIWGHGISSNSILIFRNLKIWGHILHYPIYQIPCSLVPYSESFFIPTI
jgi:hypothetical protein